MPRRLIECVPNFSEGRDRGTIAAIGAAIGGTLLDRHSDPDHNRTVFTFAGAPEAVMEGALRAIAAAVERIDLRAHAGVHPRIGAADVVPLTPVEGVSMEECAAMSEALGERVWRELRLPVYLYEAAARRPEHRRLEQVRRRATPPDIGGPELHPTAGAVVTGARGFLIACNINLATSDVELARRVARLIRASSGGFPHVKAMGVMLGSRGLAQVSMNLTDFERIPVEQVYETVRAHAPVDSTELVGMVPRRAFEMAPEFYRRAANFHSGLILEDRLADG